LFCFKIAHVQADALRTVLSEVNQPYATTIFRVADAFDADRLMRFMRAHRRCFRIFNTCRVIHDFRDRLPGAVVESWFRPSRLFQSSVISFAFAQIRADDRSERRLPLAVPCVGIYVLHTAVGIFDLKLREYGNTIAIEVGVTAIEAEASAVPSVTEPESQCVGTGLQFVGHIVGEAFHALVVVAPAWYERVIADFDAVDFGFHKTECA